MWSRTLLCVHLARSLCRKVASLSAGRLLYLELSAILIKTLCNARIAALMQESKAASTTIDESWFVTPSWIAWWDVAVGTPAALTAALLSDIQAWSTGAKYTRASCGRFLIRPVKYEPPERKGLARNPIVGHAVVSVYMSLYTYIYIYTHISIISLSPSLSLSILYIYIRIHRNE